MSWIIIAMLPSFFWALSNLVDQFVARSYFDGRIAPFLILSGLCTIPVLGVLYLIEPAVLDLNIQQKLILFGCGALQIAAIVPYLKALQTEDSSAAIPIFQCIPFLIYLLGWVFLGEVMEPMALLGGLIIMGSGIALNWEPQTRRLNLRVLGLMGFASLLFALQAIIIRQMVQEVPWIACSFWAFVFWCASAMLVAIFRPSDRAIIKRDVSASKGKALWLCSLQEWLDCAAQALIALAFSLAPTAAHVSFLGGLAPLYILAMVWMAGRIYPDIFTRLSWDRHMLRKLIFCCCSFAGLGVFVFAVTG